MRADSVVYHHSESPERAPSRFVAPPHPWAALVTSCLALFVIAVNTTAINTAASAIADELSISASELAWALNAYLVAVAALVVLGGDLGDMLGRRPAFMVGVVITVVAGVVVASAESSGQLIAGRALQGAGSAVLMPGTMAILRDAFPKEKQGMALGIWGAVGGLGFALGPLIGGFFTDEASWRWVWWTNIPAGILLVALGAWSLKGLPGRRGRVHVDVLGLTLLLIGLVSGVLVLQQGATWGWTSTTVVGLAVAAVVTLAWFVRHELHTTDPLVHLRLLKDRMFAAGNVGTFVNAVGLIGILYFFNLFVQSVLLLDWSALTASVALLPYGLCVFVASLVAGRLADRVGARWPVAVGLILMAIGSFLFATVNTDTTFSGLWLPSVVAGLGVGVTFSTPSAAGLRVVPPLQAGEASGVINVSRYIGAVLVVAVGTLFYSGVAVNRLNQSLDAAGVSGPERAQLDTVLTGSPDAVSAQVKELQGADQQAFVDGARNGTVDGFRAALLVIAVSSLAGAVAWTVLASPRRRAPVAAT